MQPYGAPKAAAVEQTAIFTEIRRVHRTAEMAAISQKLRSSGEPADTHPRFTVTDPATGGTTYRFLLLLHPRRHLRNRPVDRSIFVQVRQILAAEDGQGLTSIQRPRPKRQFAHFYKRCSINLFDLLGVTGGLLRVLMEKSVAVIDPVDGRQARVRSSANRAGQARVSLALYRSLSLLRSAVPPRFSAPWPTWRTLQTHAARCDRPNPRSRTAIPTQLRAHAR